MDQHGPAADIVGSQRVPVDRTLPGPDPHHHAVQVGDAVQGQPGHVGRAGEAVERAVEEAPVLSTIEMRPMWNSVPGP